LTTIKDKVYLFTPGRHTGTVDLQLHSFVTSTLDAGEWSTSCPNRFISRTEPRYALNRGLGGPQSRFGRLWRRENLWPLPGLYLRTVQPVAHLPHRQRHFISPIDRPSQTEFRHEIFFSYPKRQNSISLQRPSGDQIMKNKTHRECATYGERRGVYRALVEKPGVKRPYERPRRRWKYTYKMDLQEIG